MTSSSPPSAVTLHVQLVPGSTGWHYVLNWNAPARQQVAIRVSAGRAEAAGAETVIEHRGSGSHRFVPDRPEQPHYFFLAADHHKTIVAGARLAPLAGGCNFRDLGGYETQDGRRVKWGRLFRSGVLNNLTDADMAYLKSLGVHTIFDLRRQSERTQAPTPWPAMAVTHRSFPDPPEAREIPGLPELLDEPGTTPDQVEQAMTAGYASIAYRLAPLYRELFATLAEGHLPLIVHCSAGKDRTGIAAALILHTLGVRKSDIVDDYALSAAVVDFMDMFTGDEARRRLAAGETHFEFMLQHPTALVAPLVRSEPQYLEAALAALERDHGGVGRFLETELGVTRRLAQRLRDHLLE